MSLRIERLGNHLQTVGLSSIEKPEMSVSVSVELPVDWARRLLFSVAAYLVSANCRFEAGETLCQEGRSYRLEQARGGVLRLRLISGE